MTILTNQQGLEAAESTRRSGYATGMAGEFFVISSLFRLGHLPTLTLRNAKSIDILVEKTDGQLRKISVKASRGGGKWMGVGKPGSGSPSLVYVLLLYKDFEDVKTQPEVYVIPSQDTDAIVDVWHDGSPAIYFSNADYRQRIEKYRDAWHLI
jgi:hypothetical protein